MRTRIAIWVVAAVLGCGAPAESVGESESEGEGEGESESESESESEGEGEAEGEGEGHHETTTAAPSCDRVRPCIEAFVEVAPDELAGPARIALAQLDTSLAETSAREPACAAAIASYRHDLETRELDVPEACR